MPDFMQIVSQFGVPTGLLVWFLYDHSKTLKKIELLQITNQKDLISEMNSAKVLLDRIAKLLEEKCK